MKHEEQVWFVLKVVTNSGPLFGNDMGISLFCRIFYRILSADNLETYSKTKLVISLCLIAIKTSLKKT